MSGNAETPGLAPGLRNLGLEPKQLEAVERAMSERAGLVVVTGPPGSGVTTTQYAFLLAHDAFMQNLLTLEKRPMCELPNVTQHLFEPQSEKDYAAQLQTVLRREPDVVLVGECPDAETAKLSLKASRDRTPRRIYLAMGAKDTCGAVSELCKLTGDPSAMAETLRFVISPRAMRKLCPECREAYRPDPVLVKKAGLTMPENGCFYRPPKNRGEDKVCSRCGGQGFAGYTGAYEVLMPTDSLRSLILKGAPPALLREKACAEGMEVLAKTSLAKVLSGSTAVTEALRVLRA